MTQEKISECSLQSSLGSVPFPFSIQIIGHCPTKSDQSSKGQPVSCFLWKLCPSQVPHNSGTHSSSAPEFWSCVVFKQCVLAYSSAHPCGGGMTDALNPPAQDWFSAGGDHTIIELNQIYSLNWEGSCTHTQVHAHTTLQGKCMCTGISWYANVN